MLIRIFFMFTVFSIFQYSENVYAVPTAIAQNIAATEDISKVITLRSTGRSPTYAVSQPPVHGALTGSGTNQVTYTPSTNYNGTDEFSFTATDASGTSAAAMVTLTIAAANDIPTADAVTVQVDAGATIDIALSGHDVDGDALTYTARGTPAQGSVSAVFDGNHVTYTAALEAAGADSFGFDVSDGYRSSPATVTVEIAPVPMAAASYVTAASGTRTHVYLRGVVAGELAPSLSCAAISSPEHGVLLAVRRETCHFLYYPDGDYFGTDAFDFTVTDGTHVSESATLNINVAPPTGYAGMTKLQTGVNWIPYSSDVATDTDTHVLPETIHGYLADIGADSVRQTCGGDILRSNVETRSDYDFENFETVLSEVTASELVPIYTIGSYMFASCSAASEFDKNDPNPATFEHGVDADCENYLDAVVAEWQSLAADAAFSGTPIHIELGNEMFHWVSYDDTINYTFEEQAGYLQFVADKVAAIPDVIRYAPSIMVGDELSRDWRDGVAAFGFDGDDFDIETIHEYGEWRPYRDNLIAFERTPGKLLYLTETGETRDADNTNRTSGNSPEIQAAQVWVRAAVSWGAGVTYFAWHPLYDDEGAAANDYGGYGLIATEGAYSPAAYAYRNMTQELVPFTEVTDLSSGDVYQYQFITDARQTKYLVWGDGTATVPSGMSQMASVVPGADGSMTWQSVAPGQEVTLDADYPYLLK